MALGLGFPLNVMQLLWINIISDIFPGLALSLEAPEPDIMEQTAAAGRRTAVLRQRVPQNGTGVRHHQHRRPGGLRLRHQPLRPGAAAGSLAFQALVFGQLLHAFSCRSDHHSLLGKKRPPTNPYLNAAVGGSLALQVLTLFIPGLRGFLGLTPPAVIDAAVIGATALLPFLANESRKLVQSNPTQEVTT